MSPAEARAGTEGGHGAGVLTSFEKMLTSFAYTPTAVVADDIAAGRTRKKRQKKTKKAATPKREKTSPAPPHTPPRPPSRRAGLPSLTQLVGAIAGDATTAAESATTMETTATDSTLVSASGRQRHPNLAVPPSGPCSPLVLPPPHKCSQERNQIEATDKRKKRSCGDGERKPAKKKVVVISPYFAAASSDQRALEGGAGAEGEVEAVVHRTAKKKRTSIAAGSAAKTRPSSGCHPACSKVAAAGKKKGKREHQSVQLSAAESMADAYKRVPDDNPWVPPFSDHELLQELHFFDHWRVLVICMLLNRTTGREVQKVLPRLFLLCPDAETTTKVFEEEIEEIIRHLGLQKKRSRMIKRMSEEYLQPEWTHVTQLHGIGKYAADAYAIFCSGLWKEVKPNDHKLVDYWGFLLNDKDARKSILVQKFT